MLKVLLIHITLGIFIGYCCFFGINIWIFIIGIHLYLALMVYGSAYIGSGFYLKAFLRAKTNDKVIALTFDDGIHTQITPQVLDILAQYQVKATFFLIGKHLDLPENQNILRRMLAEGHTIGNHSYSHSPFFDFYSTKRVESELRQVHRQVFDVTGDTLRWFRPPYGVTNPNIGAAVRALGYQTIGWSLRSLDTVIKDVDKLLARVLPKLKGGDVVLLHDHHAHIVEFLPRFLEAVKGRGYEVLGLEQLMENA